MIKDRTIYRIGLLLAVLCLAGGLFFRFRYRLPEPVFIENEKAVAVRPSEEPEGGWYADLTLRYITDEENDRMIWSVEFPELGESVFFGDAEKTPELLQEEKKSGQYFIHTAAGRLMGRGDMPSGGAVITKGKITYTDGSVQTVSLGKIVLTGVPAGGGDSSQASSPKAEFTSLSADSSGRETQIYEMAGSGTVTVKEVLFPETTNDLFIITVNGTELAKFSSLQLEKGDELVIECKKAAASLMDDGFTDRRPAFLLEVDMGGKKQLLPYFYQQEGAQAADEISCYKIFRYLDRRGVFG